MIAALLLSLALSQTGICQQGKDCAANSFAGLNQTRASFPACPGARVSMMRYANDGANKGWWFCDGTTWQGPVATSSGGFGGCLTVSGGTITYSCPVQGATNQTFTTGLNGTITMGSGGTISAGAGISGGGAAITLSNGLYQDATQSIALYANNGGTISLGQGQTTAALAAIFASLPQLQFDSTKKEFVLNEGDGGNEVIATDRNGFAGDSFSGYYLNADFVSTHGIAQIACYKLSHPIVGGSQTFLDSMSTKVGGTGGTYAVSVVDETSTYVECQKTGISCTTAVGQPGSSITCLSDAGVPGDIVCLQVDTTGCTGTDPTLAVTWTF